MATVRSQAAVLFWAKLHVILDGTNFFFLMRSQPNVSLFLSLSPYWVSRRNWEGLPRHLLLNMSFEILPSQTFSNWRKISLGELSEDKSFPSVENFTLFKHSFQGFLKILFLFPFTYSQLLIFIVVSDSIPKEAPSPILLAKCESSVLYKRIKTLEKAQIAHMQKKKNTQKIAK